MTTIHATLTGDRQELILMAAGESAHDLAQAAKRLQTLTPAFSKTDPPGALTAPLSWPLVVQLEATFNSPSMQASWVNAGTTFVKHADLLEWIGEEAARRTAPLSNPGEPPTLPAYVPIPAGLTPRPYQVAGALEIARTGSALIFDEPRTGKTITTILGLSVSSGPQQLHGLPILVICPASVVDPWVEEFTRWAPYWRTVAWRGPRRQELAGTADVYVTSYDTARADAHEGTTILPKLGARTVVADESHYLKNPQAHRTRAVKRLARKAQQQGGAFVGLSGTPITHHPGDLHPTLACLDPGAWPSRARYVDRFCQKIQGDYKEEILGLHPATEPEFRLSLLGQHRRVARADVMADLPPKTYSVRTVDLPAKWRKAYDDFEESMYAELPADPVTGEIQELSVMSTLSMLSHLSALSSAAADVEVTYGPDVDEQTQLPKRHVHLELKAPSWKVDALLEILEERCGPDVAPESREKVVVFAESAQLVRLAGAAAEAAGYRVGYIIGGQSQGARTETRQAFQQPDHPQALQVVCATTGAGGTGITLSAAGTLVFLQRPWSLVESLQAEDRAEGDLSSTRGTEVIDVVARNTVDSRRRAVLRERAGQLAELVQDPRIVTELLGGSRATRTERQST